MKTTLGTNTIEEIKKTLETNSYPPAYNLKLWNKYRKQTNCYAYALNLFYSVIDNDLLLYYPGGFIGESLPDRYYNIDGLIFNLHADLESLGFDCIRSSLKEKIKKGEFKILLAIKSDNTDFHFLRQDKNGYWSHKNGWYDPPTNKDSFGKKIANPEKVLYPYLKIDYYKITKKQ